MYLDGLEIAGLGAGMVFLALVVMLIATLSLRLMIDKLGGVRVGRRQPAAAPTPAVTTEEPPVAFTPVVPEEPAKPKDKAARAAAIAVALYLTEEEEAEGRRGQ